MKSIFLFFGAFILVQDSFCQTKIPDSIIITYTNCNTETIVGISCDRFDNQFADWKKDTVIRGEQVIGFTKLLKNFVKLNWDAIDVRAKIEFIFKDKILKYCFNNGNMFSNGTHLYKNIQLFKLIKKAIPDFCTYVPPKYQHKPKH